MEWYYTKDGTQLGPLSQAELIAKISTGEVNAQQLAWHEGVADWQPISNFPELQITSTPGSVTPPPMQQGGTGPRPAPATPSKTSGLAVASLCLGAGSFLLCGIFMAIPAIICGHMALGEIKRSNDAIEGKAMAVIGLVIGYFITILSVLVILFFVFVMSAAAINADDYDSYAKDTPWEEYVEDLETLDSMPDAPAPGPGDREMDLLPTPAD